DESASARRNFVFGPTTFTTGWRPIVLVTTPPHPASNARRMFDSDSVGGADDSRNGLGKRNPVNVVERSGPMNSSGGPLAGPPCTFGGRKGPRSVRSPTPAGRPFQGRDLRIVASIRPYGSSVATKTSFGLSSPNGARFTSR